VFPVEGDEPEALSKTTIQLEASLSEVASANEEIEGQVIAVIAPPVAVDPEGNLLEADLSVTGDTITAVRPEGSVALVIRASSAPEPVAICARTASSYPTIFMATCGPEEAGDSAFVSNFDWLDESVIYAMETFTDSSESGVASSRLYKADKDGMDREAITTSKYLYFAPQVSADNSRILATRCDLDETDCAVHIMDADGSNDEEVVKDNYTGRGYLPTFGPNSNEVFFFRASPTGANEEALERQLYYIDSAGTSERRITDVTNTVGCPDEPPCNLGVTEPSNAPSVSPDGEEIIFTHNDEVWQVEASAEDADLEEMKLLTELEGEEAALWPTYSPDGSAILYYYALSPSGSTEDGVFTMNPDGSEKTRVVAYQAGTGEARSASFSPEEDEIAYLHQGMIFAVDDMGLNERLVSDGDERKSLAQMVTSGASADVETAEAVETRIEDVRATLSSSSDGPLDANDAEKAFCINNIYNAVECWYFLKDRDTALEARGDVFTARNRVDRSTRGNAFQHGFWTALMVRHSVDSCPVTDGLVFALLHEGDPPYSWDSRMDVLNDFVGSKYACEHDPNEDWKICEGLRIKSRRAIFMGAHINPTRWANEHNFESRHLVFRKLRADAGIGPIVRLNGRTCEPPVPT
jgi:Tol biopolymer transport system component